MATIYRKFKVAVDRRTALVGPAKHKTERKLENGHCRFLKYT